jgi:iron(III) transport system ATP-binding protein
MNVYLGNSMESFVHTPFGEVLVQIDDPHSKKIHPEGAEVSIDFAPDRVRILNESEE